MRRTALSTFLIVAILGLGCMGVSVPGRATHTCETGGLYEMTGENCYIDYQLKHSIKLGAKCWDFFKHSSELPKTPIRRGAGAPVHWPMSSERLVNMRVVSLEVPPKLFVVATPVILRAQAWQGRRRVFPPALG